MGIPAQDFYPGYVQTYVERDVRTLKNISDLGQFQLFLKLCAGRTGQLLNMSALANECGISHTTVKSWISLLEAGYIVFLLRPYHQNFGKRLVKMPKLYFYDPGLAAYLLEIQSPEQLHTHYLKGALFESLVLIELVKKRFNRGKQMNCSFWRDKTGNEVDCLIDRGDALLPMEIKAGRTVTPDFFKGLEYYTKLAGDSAARPCVVYGGNANQNRSNADVISWKKIKDLLS